MLYRKSVLFQSALQIKSLVADALRITVCARERYMVATGNIEFMHHSNQKGKKKKVYTELYRLQKLEEKNALQYFINPFMYTVGGRTNSSKCIYYI